MEWKDCIKCNVKFPRPALTKELVCMYCEPPHPIGSE